MTVNLKPDLEYQFSKSCLPEHSSDEIEPRTLLNTARAPNLSVLGRREEIDPSCSSG